MLTRVKRRMRSVRAGSSPGAIMVEAAFALPIFLLFVYGIFDFASMYRQYNGVMRALSDAARAAQIASADPLNNIQDCTLSACTVFLDRLRAHAVPEEAVWIYVPGDPPWRPATNGPWIDGGNLILEGSVGSGDRGGSGPIGEWRKRFLPSGWDEGCCGYTDAGDATHPSDPFYDSLVAPRMSLRVEFRPQCFMCNIWKLTPEQRALHRVVLTSIVPTATSTGCGEHAGHVFGPALPPLRAVICGANGTVKYLL
jgi:hypothetical protein